MLFNLFHFLISYMCRWFGVQDNAGIDPAVPGVNRTILPICGGPLMTAKGCRAKASVLFDGARVSTWAASTSGEPEPPRVTNTFPFLERSGANPRAVSSDKR